MAQAKLYDQYYTSADVTVIFSYNGRQVMVDKAVGVGFRHEISSSPVYALGNRDPIFFSIGNSLGQGQLDLAFKSEEYLRTAINFLTSPVITDAKEIAEIGAKIKKGAAVPEEDMAKYTQSINRSEDQSGKSISHIKPLIDIIILLNNASALKDDSSKSYTLYGVKFTEEVLGANSGDDGVIHDTYRFMFKNIK